MLYCRPHGELCCMLYGEFGRYGSVTVFSARSVRAPEGCTLAVAARAAAGSLLRLARLRRSLGVVCGGRGSLPLLLAAVTESTGGAAAVAPLQEVFLHVFVGMLVAAAVREASQ
eukprot:629769-Pleurochrysis_carterae.AAC.2